MFVHLHCHSYYSLMQSTISPEQLVQCALQEPGLTAPMAALTDTDEAFAGIAPEAKISGEAAILHAAAARIEFAAGSVD